MRLICPNCSAQYEIETSLIPDEGRDVQCSNCGHTWFELPPPPEDFAAPPPATGFGPESEAAEPSLAARAIAAASEEPEEQPAGIAEPEPETAEAEPAPGGTRFKPRRPADEAALNVLREEAEREISRRRAPPSEPIETQTDLGLDEVRNRATPSRALRARMAHLRPDEDDDHPTSRAEAVSEADYRAPRRDLLPDIDEINSTLKPTRRRAEAGASPRQRSGFRAGFTLMVLVAVALILTYARAPAIARALPSAETAILTYVDGANRFRDWIDSLLGN